MKFYFNYLKNLILSVDFGERDYYPEKNPDYRIRRERVPVSRRFVIIKNHWFLFLHFISKDETWKPALLGIYLFVTLIVVIILVLAVIFYQGY